MDSLLGSLSSTEAVEWEASLRLDPDDADRADIRHALLMDHLTHLLVRRKRGARLPRVRDYLADLPWRAEHEPQLPQTPAELRTKVDAVMRMLGGKRARRTTSG